MKTTEACSNTQVAKNSSTANDTHNAAGRARREKHAGFVNDVLCLLGNQKKSLPGLLLLFIMGAGLDLVGLTIIGPYIALVASPESDIARGMITVLKAWLPPNYVPVIVLGWALIAVFLIRLLALLFVNYYLFRISSTLEASLRVSLLRRYQALPYTQWLMRNTSEYLAAINQHIGSFVHGIVINGLRATSDSIAGIAILSFLAISDWRAFLIVIVVFSSFALLYDRGVRARLSRAGARQMELTVAMHTSVRHAMEGLKELRVLGVEKNFTQSMENHSEEYTKLKSYFNTIYNMPRYLAEFAVIFFFVCLISLAEIMFGKTDHLSGLFGIFGFAALRLMPAANSLMAFFTHARFQQATVKYLARDFRELSPETEQQSAKGPGIAEEFSSLKAHEIYFRYPNTSDDAIAGVTLEINKGDAIALIGPSGSGKTTLVDILLGLLEPRQGSIEVNGWPLIENRRRLLDHVAYLPQHVFLIDDTIRANVAIGINKEDIDDDLVKHALNQAQLSDWVERLPNGIDTVVGDHGLRLSGGQRQRVALARAFYHRKDVIIMDEATSALDHKTEREIVNEINLLKGKTTLIVIAHRLSTVQECDKVYRFENGRIAQSGRFDEVVPSLPQ